MSLEKMGETPEKPEEEPKKPESEKPAEGEEQKLEREITTREEANEMIRKRRVAFGLDDKYPKELSPEEQESLKQKINEGIGILYSYDPDTLSPEMLEEYIVVGQEAEAGEDLELALRQLEIFLETLRKESEKPGETEGQEAVPENKNEKERILSREEILSQLGSRCEILKIERELEDEGGVYLLEVINKENTKRYTYQRKGSFMGSSGKIESSGTTIRSEDLDDGFSRTIADYNPETGEWTDQ